MIKLTYEPRTDKYNILVDGTRVHSVVSQRQGAAFIAAVETDLGYPCRLGSQKDCFRRYYQQKYGYNDINL